MPKTVPFIDPCAGCFFGQARTSGLSIANKALHDGIITLNEVVPPSSEVDSTHLTSDERHLGELGKLVDRVTEITQCDGPVFAVQIGRLSLVSVCRKYWEGNQKVAAVLLAIRPTIVAKKQLR